MNKKPDKHKKGNRKRGGNNMPALKLDMEEHNNLSVSDIEKALGIDNIEPIRLTESDAKDRLNKGENFDDWYEEELRKLYGKNR